MRRALTLMELLLALALLAALTAGLSAWIHATTALSLTARHEVEWHQATEAAFRLIEDDLTQGDVSSSDLSPSARGGATARATGPRIYAENGRLLIKTRVPGTGATTRVFDRDGQYDWLYCVSHDPSGEISTRRLVDSVAVFECELDTNEARQVAHLIISITSTDGDTVSRTFLLP